MIIMIVSKVPQDNYDGQQGLHLCQAVSQNDYDGQHGHPG